MRHGAAGACWLGLRTHARDPPLIPAPNSSAAGARWPPPVARGLVERGGGRKGAVWGELCGTAAGFGMGAKAGGGAGGGAAGLVWSAGRRPPWCMGRMTAAKPWGGRADETAPLPESCPSRRPACTWGSASRTARFCSVRVESGTGGAASATSSIAARIPSTSPAFDVS